MTPNANPNERVLLIRVTGDLVSTTADTWRARIQELVRDEQWAVLKLDLAEAKMVDSVGLNLIVTTLRLVQKRGGACKSPTVARTCIAPSCLLAWTSMWN